MIVAVQKETHAAERRVALTPQGTGQLKKLGLEILVESQAGAGASYSDAAYEAAGAKILTDRGELFAQAQLVLQVRGPAANPSHGEDDWSRLRRGLILLGLQDPLWRPEVIRRLAEAGITVLALEMLPRISRAQSMDVLSSMATIAGYKASILAAENLPKMFPMMMTAAGTLTAARVFVLGAGVAGLQAIATARRLGGVVEGYDLRPAACEQIRSLGAKAIEIPLEAEDAEDAGGYAKEQGEAFHRRQREHLTRVVAASDVVITTAAIPGAKSPILVTEEMVEGMSEGSVIVDLAAERGGNCELTEPDLVVVRHGVTILGPTDLASTVPLHASQMFSNNVTSLLKHLVEEGELVLNTDDEISRDTTVARDGEVLHPRLREKLGLDEPQKQAAAGTETS